MNISSKIEKEFLSQKDPDKANHLMGFFKTGKGEYGEGDKFLGIGVPTTRAIVKKYKSQVNIDDIEQLINSGWHEIRLAAFLFLIEFYKSSAKRKDEGSLERIIKFYIANLNKGSNWDLVDLVAPKILGDWLIYNPSKRDILYDLASRDRSLWENRVAIVATIPLIKNREFYDTFCIAKKYLSNTHDLIHKASGWMLREIGKNGGEKPLKDFLDQNVTSMPRTMLRYAIEKFQPEERQSYLNRR